MAEAENRAPKDAGLGPASIRRISALSVSAPVNSNGDAPANGVVPATEEQHQVEVFPRNRARFPLEAHVVLLLAPITGSGDTARISVMLAPEEQQQAEL